ncbi:isopenicillin N synthase family dioxygenase [Acinetobacter portensis]|uniref:isopenicillin N synthase family dioxygenase n=1 Tax=Acinetobacter portensis TaxID=1839785 RepID=UPI0013D0DA47|nr:isopenicillin N synthase family oxygenase [Acinetobacter portensis]
MSNLNLAKHSSDFDIDSLPILNLELFKREDSQAQFLKDLQTIAKEIGFFYLVGHGISKQRIEEIQNISKQFFSLDQNKKDELAMINSPHFRGYSQPNAENTRNVPDFREQIDIGPELDALAVNDETPLWARMQGPNQWPKEWSEFQEITTAWLNDLRQIAIDLLHAFMLALGQKEDALDHLISGSPNELLKLIHYPKVDDSYHQGVGAHKDSNILTLLLQDQTGGLQVLKGDDWVDIPYVEDAFIINIGEILELATNGYLVANVHQVHSPKQQDRYSVAYFISPNLFSGEIPVLELAPELQKLAKGPTSDPLNVILKNAGQNSIKSRLRSHLDVTQKFYPKQYAEIQNNIR